MDILDFLKSFVSKQVIAKPKLYPVALIGDSHARRNQPNPDEKPIFYGWMKEVNRITGKKFPIAINVAVGGTTTHEIRKQLKTKNWKGAKIAFVSAGSNNFRFTHDQVDDVFADVMEIARDVKRKGMVPFLVTSPICLKWPGGVNAKEANQKLDRLNSLIRKNGQYSVFDLNAVLNPKDLPDNVHMGATGEGKAAKLCVKIFQKKGYC